LRPSWHRFIAFLSILLVPLAARASCAPDSCVSPCTYQELVSDTQFLQDCNLWSWDGASRVSYDNGYTYVAEFAATGGSLTQDFSVPSNMNGAHSVGFGITINNNGTVGTERLQLKIINPSNGAILEWPATFFPGDGGQYNFSVSNYSGQTIRIQMVIFSGHAPGNTTFDVGNVEYWANYN